MVLLKKKKPVKLFMLFNEMSTENTVVDFQLTAVAVLIYAVFPLNELFAIVPM